MTDLLERARAVPTRPTGSLHLSEFATSGRLLRLAVRGLEGPDTETSIVLAADNADTSAVPEDIVIFYPDEIAQMHQNGGIDPLLWQTKREFGPHLRSFPEQTEAPCTPV